MSLLQTIQASLPGFAVDVFRLCLWLVILTAIFVPLERVFALRPKQVSGRERLADIGYFFVNSLVPALLLSAPLSFVAVIGKHIVPGFVPDMLAALPIGARLLLALVIGEIGFYWGHRLSHQIPWLWRFHAVHHRAEHIYYLVASRAHLVDLMVTRFFGLIPLYLIGLAGPSASGTATPVLVLLIGTVWGYFIHANVRWRFGPLEWLISTPAFHHWHHSRIDHTNRNYASMLPFLDRLFGTLYLPRHWPADYGVAPERPTAVTIATPASIRTSAGK